MASLPMQAVDWIDTVKKMNQVLLWQMIWIGICAAIVIVPVVAILVMF